MTVMEYLKFVAELKKIPKDKRSAEVRKASTLVKLNDVSNRLIRNLSKGYKQRTGLAAAVLGFPDIIILDEPTVGLDPKQIIEIRQLIRKLAKDHTVILSSHILAEVQEICDYVLIISKGKLVGSGTPEELEELSHGKDSIELTVKSDADTIQSVLDRIDGIQNVTWRNQGAGSCDLLVDTSKSAQEVCEDISIAFATERIPVTRINILKATLEDIFLELTESSQKDEEGETKR